MNRLLRIELIKLKSNASFWVLMTLHIVIITLVILSGKRFFDLISINDESFKNMVDPAVIPVYQFPDIWHNLTYVAGFLKFILAIFMIISVTSEINYNTLRQNIMNGISRFDFILAKLIVACMLALGSALFVCIFSLILGFVSTPGIEFHYIIKYSGFIPAYFLQLTTYLVFAMFIALLIKRTGLALGLLFLYSLIIEPLVLLRIEPVWVKDLFPVRAINNLIHQPFGRYLLREVQDFVSVKEIITATLYLFLLSWLSFQIIKRRDL